MIFTWITGLLLFIQLNNLPDNLSVNLHGEPIVIVNRADFTPLPGVPLIDADKYDQLMDLVDQQVSVAPVNAVIDAHGKIQPERVGYALNRQKFTEVLYYYLFGSGPAKIEAPRLSIYPKIDSELLAHIRIQRIGQYVTYFNSNNEKRSQNISLALAAINNHVLFPGETFSFNKVVGKRTPDKGYLRAPIIVKGELSEGIGGGICQVSSTLFNAVDRAGMKIVERYSHSRNVPYVPPGRDATVSWYGPDFRFKNRYNQPILIQAKTTGGSVIVTIYSSDVINFEPRKVPRAAYQVPEEISISSDINQTD